ncbi:AhpC/TSA family protein [Rhodobacteraceae bacterium N5(2021)]|uniref:AhpC/TSA family protein n=1 Tax=Gymnodinialimonas phycosphaerae TaxID=2841589 RepID=A0A975TTT5_9RHOB|nr:peroxiredoxin-like family protein [Gymnodinialimonas phycosphaerae]MBY4894592.1 AhpC/TSA family protein [Gymnodinialimonas phycosphaerae]
MLMPRQAVPALSLPQVGGGTFDLAAESSPRGTVVCFYRGLHCPLCAKYLTEFESLVSEFTARGVGSIAISSDGAERGAKMKENIGAKNLRFAYDMSLAKAREWGLYISTSRGKTSIGIEEPALFAEPGLFLINPDNTLYYMSVQTMPFVRPHFRELLGAVDFAIEKSYPARGEYTGEV